MIRNRCLSPFFHPPVHIPCHSQRGIRMRTLLFCVHSARDNIVTNYAISARRRMSTVSHVNLTPIAKFSFKKIMLKSFVIKILIYIFENERINANLILNIYRCGVRTNPNPSPAAREAECDILYS